MKLFGVNTIYKNISTPPKNNKEECQRDRVGVRFRAKVDLKNVDERLYSTMKEKTLLAEYLPVLEEATNISKEQLKSLAETILKLDKYYLFSPSVISLILRDEKPQVDEFVDLVDRFERERVSFSYLYTNLKLGISESQKGSIDFDIVDKMLNFRIKAQENRNLLCRYDSLINRKMLDSILFDSVNVTYKTLDLLGEKAFIYAFKDKTDNLLDYMELIGLNSWGSNPELYNKLKTLTNPKETVEYKNLETLIKNLKSKWHSVASEDLKLLKIDINTATRQKQDMLDKSIKDPKDVLECALIVSAMLREGLENDAIEYLENYNSGNLQEKKRMKSFINQKLIDVYKISEVSDKVLEKLDFSESKYLYKLFYARKEFQEAFKNLVKILDEGLGKETSEVLNEQAHNKRTKMMFERYGLNYDKWVSPNLNLNIVNELGSNNSIMVQKADMDNLQSSLFLGDDASCCTKLNGRQASSAVTYVLCKMIQTIEVLHNGSSVGNTMCYFARIDDVPALILDNIELKNQYKKDNYVRNLIFDYAVKFASDVGWEGTPVFVSVKRNDINTMDLPRSAVYNLSLIGDTGENVVYLDIKSCNWDVNDKTRNLENVSLVPITQSAQNLASKYKRQEL